MRSQSQQRDWLEISPPTYQNSFMEKEAASTKEVEETKGLHHVQILPEGTSCTGTF